MGDYRALLGPSPGLQPFVITSPQSPPFKVYGQLCFIYPRAPLIPILERDAYPYITLNLSETINHRSFLWVWCYINGVSPPKLDNLSDILMIYPILKMFGISPYDKRLEERGSSLIILSREECRLSKILSDRKWYSFTTAYLQSMVGVSRDNLLKVAESLGANVGDHINVFSFGNVEYMGFETRRLDYERDKALGTNMVEAMIRRGDYR